MKGASIIEQSRAEQSRAEQSRAEQSRAEQPYCQNPKQNKILLVTLYTNYNYGNILQRYALTSIFQQLGLKVEHLCGSYKPSFHKVRYLVKLIAKIILAILGVKKYRAFFQRPTQQQIALRATAKLREKRMEEFQDNFTPTKIFMFYRQALKAPKSFWENYAFALTGSDQVWHNWSKTPEELSYYYLEFMPREKRISYAPSFGFSEFPERDIELHKKGLSGFERLSCREQEGVELIRQLTGREAQLVLDPTLLLTPEQWRKAASKPKYFLPEKYVFTYFIGDIVPEYEHAINNAAGNLQIINIQDNKEAEYYATHPGEFIYLIDNADFICTDSFHGTAFSINFGKNFLVFKRKSRDAQFESMFGRIASILESTGINNHVYNDGAKVRPDFPDYVGVNEKLSALRESSMKYLRDCLKV